MPPPHLQPTCRPARLSLGPVGTLANLVTVVRTLGAIALGGAALVLDRTDLLAAGYAVYWLGDMLDGFVARLLHQETRLGAVLDIVSDRACTSLLCLGLIAHLPHLAGPLLPFFVSFMVLDTILSLAFLCWPLLGPNDFGVVDRVVHRLNWSPPAKALNTAAVVLLALAGVVWAAVLLTVVLVGVKLWSGLRVLRLLELGHDTARP